jgi:hypothetical protein
MGGDGGGGGGERMERKERAMILEDSMRFGGLPYPREYNMYTNRSEKIKGLFPLSL